MKKLSLLLFLIFSAAAARAEYGFEMGVSPEGNPEIKDSSSTPIMVDAYAQALAEELTATRKGNFWETVGISSFSTGSELNQYIRKGFARTDLAGLVVIAEESRQKLADLAKMRTEGKGKKMKDIASKYNLDYDQVWKKSRLLRQKSVDRMGIKKLDNKEPYERRD